MFFNYEYRRLTTKDAPLNPGATALVIYEAKEGVSPEHLADHIMKDLNPLKSDLLRRRITVLIQADSPLTAEDANSLAGSIKQLDDESTNLLVSEIGNTVKDPQEASKEVAKITSRRLIVQFTSKAYDVAKSYDADGKEVQDPNYNMNYLMSLFDYLHFDLSGYTEEQLSKAMFKLGVVFNAPFAKTFTISTEVANMLTIKNTPIANALNRQVYHLKNVFADSAEGLDNPLVRIF